MSFRAECYPSRKYPRSRHTRTPRLCIALPFALLTALLSGCATYSLHPLYKPDDNAREPGLVGTWIENNDKIAIQANKDGTYEAGFTNSDSQVDYKYTVRLVRLGNDLFADAILDDESLDGKNIDLPFGVKALHILFKMSLNGDTLQFAQLNHDWLVKQFEAKKISIAHEYMDENPDPSKSDILFTASPADLQRFIRQVADTPDAFEEPEIAHRQK